MRWQSFEARVEQASLLHGIYLYTPYDALFVQELKDLVPHDLRVWERDDKRWYVFESYAEQAVKLARRYWPNIDLSDYRANAHGRGQQSQSSSNYQQTSWSTPGISQDHATLFVMSTAPREVVTAAYKALARLYHPDTGGDASKMQAVNAAYERLKKAGKA
jgi:hypothetical protein